MTSLRKLGSSDLEVFPLSLGGNVFGWTADEAQSFAVLDAYAAAGGNFVDTADSYSAWVRGQRGRRVRDHHRQLDGGPRQPRRRRHRHQGRRQHPEYKGLTAANIKAAAEASLRRLGTDHIDLYYTHFDDPRSPSRRSSPPSTTW